MMLSQYQFVRGSLFCLHKGKDLSIVDKPRIRNHGDFTIRQFEFSLTLEKHLPDLRKGNLLRTKFYDCIHIKPVNLILEIYSNRCTPSKIPLTLYVSTLKDHNPSFLQGFPIHVDPIEVFSLFHCDFGRTFSQSRFFQENSIRLFLLKVSDG